MSRSPDLSLTSVILLVLVAPLAIAGAMRVYAGWCEGPPRRRRLTDAEVRRVYPVIWERVRAGQWG